MNGCFARDPDNFSYAEAILKAATAGRFKKTAAWMADMMFTSRSCKPQTFGADFFNA